jgi:hypothetical protein
VRLIVRTGDSVTENSMHKAQGGSGQNEFKPWCSNRVSLLRASSYKKSPMSTDAQGMFKQSVAPPFTPDYNIRVEYGSVLYAVLVVTPASDNVANVSIVQGEWLVLYGE